ncbi:MAG: serine/threonine protein kinase [Myxococcales bacterium]|nr:serine/threonine protein kinase [Myxococcales bacterium]
MPAILTAPYPEQAPTPASGTLLSSLRSPEHPHPAESAWAATEVALPGAALAHPDVEANADDRQRKLSIKALLFGDEPPPRRVGRYTVLSRVGAGGMGVVYSAYDEALERRVALKLVRASTTADEDGGDRLRREGRAMARLSHPNIAQIFEFGEHEGQVFVAMEFVSGETLTRWLSPDDDARPQRRAWREVLAVFMQAGRGLAAAHDQGLVHRDFKP